VLNLWQKNNVFAPEVIQPLFDLANPDHPVHQNFNLQQQQNQANDVSNGTTVRESPIKEDQNSEMLNASNLQKFQYQQLMMQQQTDSGSTSVAFNKQLLEFDYGSDNDEDKTDQYQAASSNALPYQFSKVLEDPNIIKQLQNIKNIDVQRYLNEMPSGNQMEMNTAPLGGITLANINTLRGPQTINLIESKDQDVEFIGDTMMTEVIPVSSRSPTPNKHSSSKRRRSRSYSRDRDRYRGGRRRSRTRSHSRSRSRSPRNRRRNSRDRDRPRDKEREKQREIEKERRRKGLPDIKKEHLSVCSTTLWVGHLSKLVQQEELSDTFGKYGDIISIDMIPPRGCAYIVMNRRQDAHKAMQQLKNHKMHNRTITISWAAGKGVKGKEWKDYFDQTLGVTYIPYAKLTQKTDFESLEEGGMYDEDTMPAWVKEKMKQPAQPVVSKEGLMMPSFFGLPADVTAIDTSQPPPSAQALMPTAMPTFPLGARLLMPNVLPLGVPPPNMLGMVFPSTSADKSVINPALMGFPLAAAASLQQQQQNIQSDDHMDIEMEDEHHNTSKDSLLQQQAAFYNQPPPQLGMASLMMQQGDSQNDRNRNNRSNSRERDRRRRSDNYNNRNSGGRWPSNDSSARDSRGGRSENNNGRSRDGELNFDFILLKNYVTQKFSKLFSAFKI
jgi:RNA-binding protein 16